MSLVPTLVQGGEAGKCEDRRRPGGQACKNSNVGHQLCNKETSGQARGDHCGCYLATVARRSLAMATQAREMAVGALLS